MIKVICIVGPTAVGKTAMAIRLARALDGEIISCDSMQIYKRMDIGTAKPDMAEREGIVHHMLDIAQPNESFSCADFADMARSRALDVASRAKVPIFCGGTGFYLDNILNDNVFSEAESDPELRRELFEFAEKFGAAALHERLAAVDAESAEAIHQNNVKRVVRALEIYEQSGIPKSEWDRRSRTAVPVFMPYTALLCYENRDLLYERINKRVDIMRQAGLEDEVRDLFESGCLKEGSTAIQAIGYKELIEHFKGEISLDEAFEKIKKNSRNYAKRQLTWFLRHGDVHSFFMDKTDADSVAERIAAEFCAM